MLLRAQLTVMVSLEMLPAISCCALSLPRCSSVCHPKSFLLARARASLKLFFAGFLGGIASDGIGRRIIYSVGLAVCALAVAASPSSTTYTQLLLWRCLFSVGGGCAVTMMTPILADYCHEEDKGRGAGLLGAAAGTGAVFSALVLLRVPGELTRWLSIKGLKLEICSTCS